MITLFDVYLFELMEAEQEEDLEWQAWTELQEENMRHAQQLRNDDENLETEDAPGPEERN